MKYVLLQAPPADEHDYAPQIRIIDNSGHLGKKRVESLCNENYQFVGTLESDLSANILRAGFSNHDRELFDKATSKLFKLRAVLDE